MSTLSEMLTTPTTIAATYTEPGDDGIFDQYVFSVGDGVEKIVKTKYDDERSVYFTDLVPGTVYTLQMWLQSGKELSIPRSIEILTSKPEYPYNGICSCCCCFYAS